MNMFFPTSRLCSCAHLHKFSSNMQQISLQHAIARIRALGIISRCLRKNLSICVVYMQNKFRGCLYGRLQGRLPGLDVFHPGLYMRMFFTLELDLVYGR